MSSTNSKDSKEKGVMYRKGEGEGKGEEKKRGGRRGEGVGL